MPATPDILNMFLGVKPTAGPSPFGAKSGLLNGSTAEGGMVFADILGMIGNSTVKSDDTINILGEISPEQSSNQSTESNILEKLSGHISPVWMLGRPGYEAGQPFTNIESKSTKSEIVPMASDTAMSAEPLIPLLGLSNPMLTTNGLNLQNALSAVPAELKNGVYEILSAKIIDGTVELTLKSKESADAIRVSLPLEQLLESQAGAKLGAQTATGSSAGQRVTLNQFGQAGTDLSVWFDKLQLSEIRVEAVGTNSESGIDNPLKLTLSGTTNAANAGIEIILPSNEVKAFRVNQISSRFARQGGDTGGQSGDPNEFGSLAATSPSRPTMIAQRVIMKAAVADPSATFTGIFDSSDSLGLAPKSDQLTQTAFPLTDQFKLAGNSSGERIEFGSVRFTLPDKIEQLLQPGGKSVTLKIHPEHLGPARLNLNWSGDGISARVTVDSPVAQSAIERSLDRLYDQLTQAGIKVDHIGVSLSGGQTRGQFANHQSQWQQRKSSSFAASSNKEYLGSETASNIASFPVGQAQYVGNQGVNIFA